MFMQGNRDYNNWQRCALANGQGRLLQPTKAIIQRLAQLPHSALHSAARVGQQRQLPGKEKEAD